MWEKKKGPVSRFLQEKMPVVKLNPRAKEQSLHAFSSAVAGPALMYAGYRFPGTTASRAALTALGAFLTYTHYKSLRSLQISQKQIDEAKGKIIEVKNIVTPAAEQINQQLKQQLTQQITQQVPQTIADFPTLTPEELRELEDSVLEAPEFSIFDTGTVRGEGAQADLGFDIRDFAGFFQ